MRTKKETNVFAMIFYMVIISLAIIVILILVNNYENRVIDDEEELDEHNYSFLMSHSSTYITPELMGNYTTNILNITKDLNTTDYITIYRYLRDIIGPDVHRDQPRPPVETINRESCSELDFSLLYTSILIHLDYNAYTLISDDTISTIMFYNGIVYVFDIRYYSPLEIDDILIFVRYNIYDDALIMSNHQIQQIDGGIYNWIRGKI